MSEWVTRILTHPAWERLRSVRAQLEAVEVRPEDPPEVTEDLIRLKSVVDTVESRLRSADPILLFPGPMGSLDSHLQNLTSEVTSFQTNRNRAHLANANAQLDPLLAYAAQLGLGSSPSTPEAAAAIENVRSQTGQALRGLVEQASTLSAQLTRLQESSTATNAEVTAQKGRLDAAIAEYQTQFSAAEGTRQQQSTEALKAHSQRLDLALTDAQKRLQDTTLDVAKRLETSLQEASTKATQQRDELQASATTLLNDLGAMRTKAETLLHVIGSTGMAGEYQKVANTARRTSIVWQVFAAGAMIGLVTFAILTYSATQQAEIRWGGVAARAFVALTFGVIAAYGARQGDRYSDIEVRNRRYQLELSSLDPYLANLPQETQDKVKVEIAQKLFGNVSTETVASKRDFSGTGKDPLELALSILMEFAKKRG